MSRGGDSKSKSSHPHNPHRQQPRSYYGEASDRLCLKRALSCSIEDIQEKPWKLEGRIFEDLASHTYYCNSQRQVKLARE